MKRWTELISGSAAVIGGIALTAWIFCMGGIDFQFNEMHLNLVYLTLFSLAVYYMDCFLCSRGLSLGIYAFIQLIFAGAGVALFLFCARLDPAKASTVGISAAVYAANILAAAYIAALPVGRGSLTIRFDCLVLMLAILLLLDNYKSFLMTHTAAAACLIAAAATLAALAAQRAEREETKNTAVGNKRAGRIALAAATAAVAAAAALVLAAASGGMSWAAQKGLQFIKWCAAAVKNAAKFIMGVLERILRWLAQFINTDAAQPGIAVSDQDAPGMGFEGAESALPPYMLYIFLGVVVLLLAFVLFKLRREKIVRTRRVRVYRGRERRTSHMGAAIMGVLKAIVDRIKYYVNCIRYRRTAPGLLVWCEHRAKGEWRRYPGESGENFLRRLSENSQLNDAQREAVRELGAAVEEAFYSGRPVTLRSELYKRVKECSF